MNEIDDENLAKKAMKDENLLSELLQNLLSKEDKTRFPSFKALRIISEKQPELLYPKWEFISDLIDSDNAHRKFIAVNLIPNLTKIDTENKFEKIFEKFYDLLGDSVIVAGHVAANSGKIVKAKPKLEAKITNKLLNIDKTNHKHKDLIKSGAIETFDEYFETAKDKKRILEFVKEQLECTSPKTRKKAKEFLKKWEK